MNAVIDRTRYPSAEARETNLRMRPIGIGVQGLADTFVLMRYPWEAPDPDAPRRRDGSVPTKPHPAAALLNRQIFETIAHAALESSAELAAVHGPYPGYEGSPMQQGKFHHDLYGLAPTDLWDWAALRAKITKTGTFNSLTLAPMPTASTAQILGNNEGIEPFTSNLYTRKVLSGTFQVVNKHLINDLIDAGVWDDEMKLAIIANNGSVQGIARVPPLLRDLYKTVWEISQKVLIDFAAARGASIDQSQSFNVHMASPSFAKLTAMHFYGWKAGLKTGMYYLRTKPATEADKVVTRVAGADADADAAAALACSLQNPEACEMCSA